MKLYQCIIYSFLILAFIIPVSGQPINSVPVFPAINDEITVRIDIDKCTRKDLLNFTGEVYAHTGVKITSSNSWQYVVAPWEENISKAKCTRVSSNVYELTLSPDAYTYYGISATDTVTHLAFVLRSGDRSKQTEDLFLAVYKEGLSVKFDKPSETLFVVKGEPIEVNASSVAIGTPVADSIMLYVDNEIVHTSYNDTLKTTFNAGSSGLHWAKIIAINPAYTIADSVSFFVLNEITTAELPEGNRFGINYLNDSTVTLALYAPGKDAVFVIGDFNNWEADNNYLMSRSSDGTTWWITLSGLIPGEEYAFQYFIDGSIRVADLYSEKILDPWNDKYISTTTYPMLKAYPTGKTTNIAGVLQTPPPQYDWQTGSFAVPGTSSLVIYELHIQNFTSAANIKTITDTLDYLQNLGVNAIELMPVNEFEGNISWGYNPSFYFAFDKAYGTKNDLKAFVDACHSRGIAVIIDMVLNHSYSQCPLVQMYWDGSNVTADNPWYNSNCPHRNWCWGYDFNHESPATRYFVDRVNEYWLTEYKVDGFRFDFTKGFTNKADADAWGPDASRIAILKRMANAIWEVKNDAIVIFEHMADNTEEKELAEYGILLWGNMNCNYNEATMGYNEGNKSDFSWGVYSSRGWNTPSLITYMESHDEERLMYKNKVYGNSNTLYDTKETETALRRMETAAAFFFTIPGPKMIWEWCELGYDYSINTCADGTVGDCRLALKPVRWDYYTDQNRHRLYQVYKALIAFKKTEFCSTADFTYNFSGALKKLHLNLPAAYATIIGNFGITNGNIDPEFQHTGSWYDYLTGETLEVTDVNALIKLRPGEYRIYTDIQLLLPDVPEAPELPDVSSVEHISTDENFRIYPNPVLEKKLFFDYKLSENHSIHYKMYDISGKLLYNNIFHTSGEGTITINLPEYSPQVLIYEIGTGNNIHTGRLAIY
ncbi:MAG: T9SS type A sorting domain-containing protein [Bacteroidales bacterium]|nr:T9SS type A sorting domain-containing protein [Bacteroidales bacterium]